VSPGILERGEHYPRMNGRVVYVHAVKRMPEAVKAGALQPGMLVAFAAFGSGFTRGSMLVQF
jgi:3-oxoacyl-[acyl-carrier-protein] synthase III